MSKQAKVAILMATYNGEKYIRQQLDSIINQTYTNWELFISDDMSKDNTLKILKEYQQKDSRIKKIWIHNDNHGAFTNFYSLMTNLKKTNLEFDYFFFCDQDDIWNNKKIEKMVNFINTKENEYIDMPIVGYSDLNIMGTNNKIIGKISDAKNIDLTNTPYNFFFKAGYAWGTALGFNKKLWTMLNVNDNMSNEMPHDHYISYYAIAFGKICYLDEPLVNYRRHGSNVSELPKKFNILSSIKIVLTQLPGVIQWNARRLWGDIYFINHVPYKNDLLNELENAIMSGGRKALIFMKKYNINPTNDKYSLIALKLILFTKIYKHTKWFNGKIPMK